MRSEPEIRLSFQCRMSLKIPSPELRISFLVLGRAGRSPLAVGFGFVRINRTHHREAGWESGKPAFGFPLSQHASPALWECGNLAGCWRDFQGAVGRVGSLGLAFHAFHRPGISTALFQRPLRQRANKASLAFCIWRAASVSVFAVAWCSSRAGVIPFFKNFSQSTNDFSFS